MSTVSTCRFRVELIGANDLVGSNSDMDIKLRRLLVQRAHIHITTSYGCNVYVGTVQRSNTEDGLLSVGTASFRVRQSWYHSLAGSLPAQRWAGYRAQVRRCHFLHLGKRETLGKGAYKISVRGVTYRCTCFCRNAPRLSCGDRSTRRHAGGADIQGREGQWEK